MPKRRGRFFFFPPSLLLVVMWMGRPVVAGEVTAGGVVRRGHGAGAAVLTLPVLRKPPSSPRLEVVSPSCFKRGA